MKRLGLLAATAITAAALAGCGGSGNKALSYSGFGKAANKICNDVNGRISGLESKFTGDPANDAPLFDDLVPAIEKGTADFKKLKPPAKLKADFDKFNDLNDTGNELTKKAQDAAKAGDKSAYVAALKEVGANSSQSDLEASKLGAGDCLN